MAAAATVSVQAAPTINRTVVSVLVDLMPRPSENRRAAVLAADFDTNVPAAAAKHYAAALKAIESKDSTKAISELQLAIQIFPKYYAARLELGRQFRSLKRFEEAADTLQSLGELAPSRAEPHLEYALVLLGLEKRDESIAELRTEMAQLRTELRADMSRLRAEVGADMKALEQRMTIKLGSMLVVAIAIVSALVKLL